MSNGNVTNFPRESTIRELVDLQRADLAGKADAAYKEKVLQQRQKQRQTICLQNGGSISIIQRFTVKRTCWNDGLERCLKIQGYTELLHRDTQRAHP